MKKYAEICWQVEDLVPYTPDWTDEQRAAWLEQNEDDLAEAMCGAGYDFLLQEIGAPREEDEP